MIPVQCAKCKNYNDDLRCEAFEDRIPNEVLIGEFDHTKKHPDQDNNILFEPIKK